jgi:hypothetical protein
MLLVVLLDRKKRERERERKRKKRKITNVFLKRLY